MTKRGSLMVSTSRYQATGSELDCWLGKVYSTINLLWVKNEYQICLGAKQTPRWVDYQPCTYHSLYISQEKRQIFTKVNFTGKNCQEKLPDFTAT